MDRYLRVPLYFYFVVCFHTLRAFGAVIGKALHSLKGGQGIIPVLIALQ
jgi:hypothetical protein